MRAKERKIEKRQLDEESEREEERKAKERWRWMKQLDEESEREED